MTNRVIISFPNIPKITEGIDDNNSIIVFKIFLIGFGAFRTINKALNTESGIAKINAIIDT